MRRRMRRRMKRRMKRRRRKGMIELQGGRGSEWRVEREGNSEEKSMSQKYTQGVEPSPQSGKDEEEEYSHLVLE
ncbi:hypothetical protein CgunFtcFv8_025329 [Champsocephalus gunnari]|uniref:Uncharacterized protein n=1 Tax=Champsocephalus gunnari TaxID=52237 RepID=A0AAN8H379_CHAGU|nr:hypothetical protein CgunFtcFv8_025329 [Champsocephalus gunnari]